MKVDKTIEPLVREAFAACVGQEPQRFTAALGGIAERGDRATGDALILAGSVDAYALLAVHEGTPPGDPQLDYLADAFASTETWSGVPRDDAREFLAALAQNRESTLDPADLTVTTFTTGAWLLSAFLPEGKQWVDFLDEVLDALEAAPSQ